MSSASTAEQAAPPGFPPAPPSGRGSARRGERPARRRGSAWWLGALGFVLFFAAIEVLSRTSGLSEQTLPRATTILSRMVTLFADGDFLGSVGITVAGALLGLAIAIALAVPCGVLLGSSRWALTVTSPLIELLRPIPAVAVIPPALLLFGTGMTMKLFLVAYAAFWIVLYNTIYAVRDVDPVTKDSARSYGFSRNQVLFKVSLPSAAPAIYTGVRIACTAALLVAIGVELIGGGVAGVGEWLVEAQEAVTRKADVYAGAFFTGLIGLAFNLLLNIGERRAFSWSIAGRKEAA
ncbi:ABC transporter permease [Saccharomonospora sp. NPDC006951]